MNQQEKATVAAAIAILNSHLKQAGAVLADPTAVKQLLRLLNRTAGLKTSEGKEPFVL